VNYFSSVVEREGGCFGYEMGFGTPTPQVDVDIHFKKMRGTTIRQEIQKKYIESSK
jgi:hypothetical protein